MWVPMEERKCVFRLVGVSADEWAGLHISGCVFTLESVFSHTYVGVLSDSGWVSK